MLERDCAAILARLREMGSPENVAGMARHGINSNRALGVSVYALRRMATDIGADHALAEGLWSSGIHEARLLAVFVDRPVLVGGAQMESWVADFDSWDICDQACTSLFDLASPAWEKAREWPSRSGLFVKRGGYALMAGLAVHDKEAAAERFRELLTVVVQEADDDRGLVKKGASWALRSIGKRSPDLHEAAIEAAEQIAVHDSCGARWVASDVLRELRSEKVLRRLGLVSAS